MAARGARTYKVKSTRTGSVVEVPADGWLKAAQTGARDLGCEVRDVVVHVDDRVGFVSPRVVTH